MSRTGLDAGTIKLTTGAALNTLGSCADGIRASARTGSVTLTNPAAIATGGTTSNGIAAFTTNANTAGGAIAITNNGTVNTQGATNAESFDGEAHMVPESHTSSNERTAHILALVVLLLGGCSSQKAPAGPPKPHVSVANPIVREVIDWDDYVGRFEAVQDVTVMPRVSGTITQILFRNGQDVKAGMALFIIDPRPFRAAYLQAVADLSKAKATQANAKTMFERAQKLLSVQVLSKEDYDSREAALLSADADVEAQMAAVESARLNLEFTTVTAPVTGRVSDRKVSLGDTVVANTTTLTRVVTLDPIWFAFEGAESFYLKYIRKDQSGERRSSRDVPNPVEIQLADETGYPHKGRMVFVDNAIDTRSGTIRAQAQLPNPDGFLTPGMFGRARLLASGAYKAMLIPDEAIVTDQTRRLVYVVGDDGAVAPHIVETGPLVVGLRVVRKGIVATDKVVLDGLARLQPGARVDATLEKLKPRAEDTSPTSAPLTAPPSTQATSR